MTAALRLFAHPLKAIPLPTVGQLIKAVISHRLAPEWSIRPGVGLYNLGRWALRDAVISLAGRENARIFLPAYFCDESVEPLRTERLRLCYYPLDDNLNPDWSWLSGQTGEKGDVFILVHYFGRAAQADISRDFCRQRGISLVEDAAHMLEPGPGVGQAGDAVIFSPRKFLPLPAGGVLCRAVDAPLVNPPLFYGQVWAGDLLWCAKRLTQHYLWDPAGVESRQSGEKYIPKATMSPLTRRLWRFFLLESQEVIKARRHNYEILRRGLAGKPGLEPLWNDGSEPIQPHVFPLWVEEKRDRLLGLLRQRRVPAGTWPDLPRDLPAEAVVSARRIWGRILTLPVHQNLSAVHMKWMAAEIRQAWEILAA